MCFTDPDGLVQPVPGLRETDQIGPAGSHREAGAISHDRGEPWRPCDGAGENSTSGIDGDDGCLAVEEFPRGDPRAGANIEYHQPIEDPESVEDPAWVGRAG